jgi:HKD family nuclease
MKTTFLGHGLDSENKNTVGKQLTISFEGKDYNRFNGFVAFATLSGVKSLKSNLEIAKLNYEHIRFYIGIDNNVTSEDALKFLLKHNIETYIYHDEFNKRSTYHPKLFIFEGIDFSRIIIGSSNLTYQALNTNLEASIQFDFSSKVSSEGLSTLTEIKQYYSSLLDLSSPNINLLTEELVEELVKKNLLSNYNDEPKTNDDDDNNDGENDAKTGNNYDKKFTENDKQKFEKILERYITYKQNIRPSGIVSKDAEDRELFRWYQKMHALYGQSTNSFPFEIFERLLDVDFPFDGIGLKRKQLIKWNKDFQKVKDYKNKVDPDKKYTYVPQFRNKSNEYYEVGFWCAIQKQRRKGNKNYGIEWSQFEEDKMNSINFVWDVSTLGFRTTEDKWSDTYVELENYYSKKNNYKTVPTQKTYIGHWLSDQMSFKTKQDREDRNDLLILEKEKMLGILLNENGVEWEWRKQKEREGIESKIKSWQIVEKLKNEGKIKEFREKNPKVLKKYRDDVAQLKSHTKRWNNEKNNWKYELVDKVGFPYEKE